MKMSGTKPMKNTMRKPSPMKQTAVVVATKKPVDTKGSVGSPRTTVKVTKKTPAMQMKKSGMGKKC
jgi:hypothetical protein